MKLFYGQLVATLHTLPGRCPCTLLYALELVQNGVRPVHCWCRTVLYHQIPSVRETLHRLKAANGEESFSYARVCDWYDKFYEGHKEVKTQLSAGKIYFGIQKE
jgi:hypothetical protein